jgi:hypothetical protein
MVHIIPFLIEVVGDAYLIKEGKKDLPLSLRILMVAAVGVQQIGLDAVLISVPDMALATAPFCFFDNILAWLRGKRGLDYEGKTKGWDKILAKFNPHFLMVVRGLVCAGLVAFGLLKP